MSIINNSFSPSPPDFPAVLSSGSESDSELSSSSLDDKPVPVASPGSQGTKLPAGMGEQCSALCLEGGRTEVLLAQLWLCQVRL